MHALLKYESALEKILQVGVRHLVCYYCEERTTRRN